MKTSKEYLFEGVDSKKVARFLSEKMPKLISQSVSHVEMHQHS